jgi:ZIP family zinc transporter
VAQALLFAAVTAGTLVAGAALGCVWQPPRWVQAALMAFASGALISALAFELFDDAIEYGGAWRSAVGLAAGATVFVLADQWLERRTKRVPGAGSAVGGMILLAAALDGIPESLALGVTLLSGGGAALLVAIGVGNVPEGLAGAVEMRANGDAARRVIGFWALVGLASAAAVLIGYAALDGVSASTLSWPLSFAAGAVLAALADTLMPQAFSEGGPAVAYSTALGFLASFSVSLL